MRCPFCGFDDSKVVDSRVSKDGEATRRRRECISCERRFTTYERIEEVAQMVVKKDGRRENFDRWKLKAGIMKAIEKRAVSIEQVDALINDIERELFNGGEHEVSTRLLGEAVMARLKQLDEVAYVRFASVYRQFRDVNEFMSELQGMIPRSGGGKAGRKG
ncbi:MAG: Transcriptional repressor NrdR [Candidatus Hydrogenedentes bacterium ADurb.Bin101]|jgi:transcriptional repressor NrdR|nr:transcriptional repressor NrdR [Candidatus Hydrogenedentota bacterium]OQC00681.1 MAG: Transcriptional repressor NrdR [Candidatus Hydrogenedentes bacterium ADurb.Bin101]HOC69449.1 transcriptional regulator NrdR [Candidatus Hydrogenedentota bacterium]HOH28287.1 transcriptional regulator NrdR [Candidatus Hydrogenedentota bacterium]